MNGAVGIVSARQVARTDEELAHDLTAGEDECGLEELGPFIEGGGMMRVQPGTEGPLLRRQRLDAPSICDRRIDLQAVADDAGVRQQPLNIGRPVCRNLAHIKAVKSAAEVVYFLQNGEPG